MQRALIPLGILIVCTVVVFVTDGPLFFKISIPALTVAFCILAPYGWSVSKRVR